MTAYYRQRAIVRNLTAPAFLGRLWQGGKLYLWGGSRHTVTHPRYPDGGNFLAEGAYFAHEYGPTRGKTFSLFTQWYGISPGVMAGVSLDDYNHVGENYQDFLERFNRIMAAGLARPDDHFLYGKPLNDFDHLALRLAEGHGQRPLLLRSVDWAGLEAKAAAISLDAARALRGRQTLYDSYDAVVLVAKTPLTRAVQRPRAGGPQGAAGLCCGRRDQ